MLLKMNSRKYGLRNVNIILRIPKFSHFSLEIVYKEKLFESEMSRNVK